MITPDEIPPRLSRWCPPGARLVLPEQGETAAVAFAEHQGTSVVLKRCRDPRYLAWLRREHEVVRALDGIELPVPRALDYLEGEPNLTWCEGTRSLLTDLYHRQPPPVRETLIHGDLALGNLLADADGVTGLVDWPMGSSGDPRCDVALALATEPELVLGDRELEAFFRAYGSEPLDQATRRWFEDLYEFF